MAIAILDELRSAVDGLLFLSESDEPFEVFCWQLGVNKLTPEIVRSQSGHEEAAPITEVPIDRFFGDLTTVHDGTVGETADIMRYQKLRDTMKRSLSDLRVYRVGETRIAIYVVGKAADGRWYGIHTFATET